MNEKFINLINQKNSSLYKISQESGIPYTTLSEIVNKKTNINNCAVETVYKLLLYFHCTLEDILNPVLVVANVSGSYRGIKYKWIPNNSNTLDLAIQDEEKEIVIDHDENLAVGRFYDEYKLLSEARIDAYLTYKEAEAMLNG